MPLNETRCTDKANTSFFRYYMSSGFNISTHENAFNDLLFSVTPAQIFAAGPFIATGDIDHNGLADFFIGGAINFSGKIFIQQPG